MPLDPQIEAIYAEQANLGIAIPFEKMTPEDARVAVEGRLAATEPRAVARVYDTTVPGAASDLPARVYSDGAAGVATAGLVFFHGSGWVVGGLESHDAFCRELASRSGITVIAIDYRLAPEHKFPAGTEDAYAAVSAVFDQADRFGVDPSRIAVGGDSAGGNLAAVMALMARDRDGPAVRFQLLMYPVLGAPTDGRPSYDENATGYGLTAEGMRWFTGHYVTSPADYANPYFSPLRAADLTGVAPALIVTAEYDVLRDEGEEYGRRLQDAGVACTVTRYDGQVHGFMSMVAVVAKASDAFDECVAALHAALIAKREESR